MDLVSVDVTLETPRLFLRTLVPNDVNDDYVSWLNDPEINRYLLTKSATRESLRQYIADKRAAADALFLGIFLKPALRMIGTIKLEPIHVAEKNATIAIMIGDRASQGRGYGPEAMQALIAYTFDTLKLEEINLGVIAEHTGAIRAYEKVGFRETKRTQGSVRYGESVYDHVTMVLNRAWFNATNT